MKRIKFLWSKKWFRILTYTFTVLLLFVVSSNIWVNQSTKKYLYDDVHKIPARKVGLVLGTGMYLKDGRKNLFFEYRMQATMLLWNNGKIDQVVVSGDNRYMSYNEPRMMKKELVRRGIPECKITCDYAGFRTFDSVVRMLKVFGQKSFTVISQKFHNQRAIFLGRAHGIKMIGFNAKDVKGSNGIKTHIREYFARVKAVIDLYVWPAKAKFLGKEEELKDCFSF